MTHPDERAEGSVSPESGPASAARRAGADAADPAVAVAPPVAPPAADVAQEELLDARVLIRSTLVVIVTFTAFIGAASYFLMDWFKAVGKVFVAWFGGPGVALGYYVPDAFSIPVPNDAFGLFGLAGGMNFWVISAWATFGSVAGGCTGFWLGRLLQRTQWLKEFMLKRGATVQPIVRRYGALGVAVGALTPVPYSVCAWAAGALNMRFDVFFVVSLLRFPRIVAFLWVLWAIERGVGGQG